MPVPDVGASGTGGATNIPSGRGSRILPDRRPRGRSMHCLGVVITHERLY